jgi:hypothetical protein
VALCALLAFALWEVGYCRAFLSLDGDCIATIGAPSFPPQMIDNDAHDQNITRANRKPRLLGLDGGVLAASS